MIIHSHPAFYVNINIHKFECHHLFDCNYFMKDKSIPTLPQQHLFDFKVKVNYQNGAVSLVGPNQYSPPCIFSSQHHNHPQSPKHYYQPPVFHNSVPHYHQPVSMQNIPIQHIQQTNMTNYSSARCIGSQTSTYQQQKRTQQNEPVLCVICQKQFLPNDFQLHLQLHRNRNRNKNIAIGSEEQNTSLRKINLPAQNIDNSFGSQKSDKNIKYIHDNGQLYSFQKIGDSLELQQQIKKDSNFQYSLNSSNSFNSYPSYYPPQQQQDVLRRISLPAPTIVNQSFNQFSQPAINIIPAPSIDSSSHHSLSEHQGTDRMSERSYSNKNSSNIVEGNSSQNHKQMSFSQQYLKGIIQKAKNKEDKQGKTYHRERFLDDKQGSEKEYQHQKRGQMFQSALLKNTSTFNEEDNNSCLQKCQKQQNNFQGSLFYRKQNQKNDQKNAAISHRNRLKQVMHQFDSDQDQQPNRSGISSIQEIKEPLQNLSREEMILLSHGSKRNIENCYEEPQRPARPSQRNISLTREKNSQKNLHSFHSGSYLSSQNTGKEKPMSVENIGIHSRQVFRGVQVDQTQILNQNDNMSSSCLTKSSKTSTKSKLPKNYFAINDVLQRSRKQ